MNFRFTVILLAVFVVLVGAAIVVARSGPAPAESAPSSKDAELQVLRFDDKLASSLQVTRGDLTIQVDKGADGGWILQPTGEPADRVRVSSLLVRLSTLHAIRRISEGEADRTAYGLDQSALRVKVELDNGDVHTLIVGAETPTKTGRYATGGRAGTYYVIASSFYDELDRLLKEPPKAPPTPTAGPSPEATPGPALSPEPLATPTITESTP